jgi:hypothetical protein
MYITIDTQHKGDKQDNNNMGFREVDSVVLRDLDCTGSAPCEVAGLGRISGA